MRHPERHPEPKVRLHRPHKAIKGWHVDLGVPGERRAAIQREQSAFEDLIGTHSAVCSCMQCLRDVL